MKKILLILLVSIFQSALSLGQNASELEELYRKGRFSNISNMLSERPFESLAENEKYLFLESLARNGEGFRAVPFLHTMLKNTKQDEALLTVCGIVYHSAGDFRKAREFFEKALVINPDNSKALFSNAMLMLYLRDFDTAKNLYEKASDIENGLNSNFTYLYSGIDIYYASRNLNKFKAVNQKLAHYFALQNEPFNQSKYAAETSMLAKNGEKPLYYVHTSSDKIELPLFDFSENVYYKCLKLQINGRDYSILLDTGNAPGWTVHNPDLLEKISHIFGGSVNTSTGSVEQDFTSHSLITKKIDFGSFSMSNLKGLYFEKPRDSYFDANLNPIYIRDRVITIDYINNKFILRSRERFMKDMADISEKTKVHVPFYGWKWPFIPVKVNGYADALAMIETGAEDISVKREFAEFIHMPLESAEKEFRGKMYPFHQGELDVMIGSFLMHREQTEVWPKRFFDSITGLYDNVMIGPWALEGMFIIHFNPFDNEIVFQIRKDEND